MNEIEDLFERFPTVIPFEEIRVQDEEYTYQVFEQDDGTLVTVDEYLLEKAPIKEVRRVAGTYNGNFYEFDKGVDYTVIDADNDGNLDSLDFDTANNVAPDNDTRFTVTYVTDSIIKRYVGSFQQDFDDVDVSLEDVIDSRHIDNASGKDLDQIGAMFGVLGKRRGRTDSEYRALLKSIVQSFKGRGTVDGIKFAVAVGLGIDPSQVEVVEDFQQNQYSVTVFDYNGHTSETVRELSELADPSGIAYFGPVTYEGIGDNVYIRADSKITKEQIVILGNAQLGEQNLGGILT